MRNWGDAYLFRNVRTDMRVAVYAGSLLAAQRVARVHLALLSAL